MDIHEVAHNYVGYWMGDPTPREMGRLTLNPLVHINWIGWLMWVVIGFGILGSAPISEGRMRNRRWGFLAAVAAGPFSNLALAAVSALLFRIGLFHEVGFGQKDIIPNLNQFPVRAAHGLMASRIRQGLRALGAWGRGVDDDLAAQVLSPALLALFRRMRRAERQHSLNVLRTLRAQGHADPVLLTAALLHDVGKIRAPFFLWERVIVVLIKAAAPKTARRWGSGDNPTGWRRPFVISFQHPRWSAEMVAAAGGDPRVVRLIAAHQMHLERAPQTDDERLLAILQTADDAN
jgi:hypothetical protein